MKRTILIPFLAIISAVILVSTSSCEKLDELTGSTKPGKISGVVKDSITNQGLSGVSVSTLPPTSTTETDIDGVFLLESIDKGEYTIRFNKADYISKSIDATVAADKNTVLQVLLSPATPPVGTIQGTVVSSQNNAPIAGATVTTIPATVTATTDNDGKFTISNITVRTYTVNVTATGFQSGSQSVQVNAGAATTFTIQLTPSQTTQLGTIKGTITHASTGSAIADVDIITNPATKSVKSDANGNYELKDISAGTYAVTASKTGFSSASFSPVVLASGATQTVNLQLIPFGTGTGNLRVNVRFSYQGMEIAMPDVQVTVTPGNFIQMTDTSGKALFTSLPFGQYTVRCEHSQLVTVEQSVSVNSSDIVDVTIIMSIKPDAFGAIEGKVLDANTRGPIANANVFLITHNNRATVTDAGGVFTFADVPPGQHSVMVTVPGGAYQSQTLSAPVLAAITTSLEFLLQASSPATGNFYGSVLDATGRGIPAVISVTGPQSGSYQANESGRYQTGQLPFGAYQLTATAAGFQSQTQNAVLSSTLPSVELNFGLIPGGGSGTTVILGQVLNTNKLPESGVLVEIQSPALSALTNSSGLFELKGNIPAGQYQLKITKAGFIATSAMASVGSLGDTVWVGEITISPSGGSGLINISGKTISIASMKGVANTSVSTIPVTSTVSTTTDGSFAINNVNAGTYAINLAHTKYVDYRIEGLTFPLSYALNLYMFYGKYTTSQTAFYPMVETWQPWNNNYWGSAGSLQDAGTTPTTNRFGNENHARQFASGQFMMTNPIVDTASVTAPVMISFWTKITPAIAQMTPIVAWSNSAGGSGWFVAVDSDAGKLKLQITANNMSGTYTSFDPVFENDLLDKWIMITVGIRQVSVGNYQAVLYLNGVKKLDQTLSLPNYNVVANQIVVGRARRGSEGYQFFYGSIDDIRLFRTFLTDGNITDLYLEE